MISSNFSHIYGLLILPVIYFILSLFCLVICDFFGVHLYLLFFVFSSMLLIIAIYDALSFHYCAMAFRVCVSPYFQEHDYYNMFSSGSLVLISKFRTFQQSTEYTCGPVCVQMVLCHFDYYGYDEFRLADLLGTGMSDGFGKGTSVVQIVSFFKSMGWVVKSNIDGVSFQGGFDDLDSFKVWIVNLIVAGIPIMVNWMEYGGHWQVIIGYESIGSNPNLDYDVLIMAEPYDICDHSEDGYTVVSLIKFYSLWYDYNTNGEEYGYHPYVVAHPP